MADVPVPTASAGPSLERALGFEFLAVGPETARARVAVSNRLKQPFGLVHGGVYAALAESLAVRATAAAVAADGSVASGFSTQTSFIRPVVAGVIEAGARARHHGRTTWVWEVDLTDEAGRLCALTRATVAVRPA